MQRESIVDIAYSQMSKSILDTQPSLEDIFNDCCLTLGYSPSLIKGRRGIREYVMVRRIFCYVAVKLTGHTQQRIAETVGSKDHATVINHIEKIKDHIDSKDELFMDNWTLYMAKSKIWNKCK